MNYNKDVALLFANKIKEKIEIALFYVNSNNEIKKFEIIKELSSLTSELLKIKDLKNKLILLANESLVNGENNDLKIETLDFIRNILTHFPIFESWNEIYLTDELLRWNNKNNGQIKKYLLDHKNKHFEYKIYLNENDKWVQKRVILVNIPELNENNKIYLRDILNLDDAIWTFGIMDYYLKDLGLKINSNKNSVSL